MGYWTALKTLQLTDKEYEAYNKRLDELTDDKIDELQSERRSLNGVKNVKTKERDELSRKFRDMTEKHPSYAVTETDITILHNEIIDIETRVAEITSKLRNTDAIKLTKEEFLNLAKTAYDKMRAGTPLEKDILARKMLLNLSLNDERAPSFIWKEPFATVFNNTQSSFGGILQLR